MPVTLPGRAELVSGPGAPAVYVDFGHSPHAFQETLAAVRAVTPGQGHHAVRRGRRPRRHQAPGHGARGRRGQRRADRHGPPPALRGPGEHPRRARRRGARGGARAPAPRGGAAREGDPPRGVARPSRATRSSGRDPGTRTTATSAACARTTPPAGRPGPRCRRPASRPRRPATCRPSRRDASASAGRTARGEGGTPSPSPRPPGVPRRPGTAPYTRPIMTDAPPAPTSRLRKSNPLGKGYHRVRAGNGFSFKAPDGTTVKDPELRARFDALGIPPAWTDVWIAPVRERAHPGRRLRRGEAEAVPVPPDLARAARQAQVPSACCCSRRRCPARAGTVRRHLRDDGLHAAPRARGGVPHARPRRRCASARPPTRRRTAATGSRRCTGST